MEAVWRNIRKIKGEMGKEKEKLEVYRKWIDFLACEVFECDDNNEPIYINADEDMLGDSRIEKIEERMDDLENFNGIVLANTNEINNLKRRTAPILGTLPVAAGGGRTRRRRRKKRTRRRKSRRRMRGKRKGKTRRKK